MAERQLLVYRFMREPNNLNLWYDIVSYVRQHRSLQSITLADGFVLTLENAPAETVRRFPDDWFYPHIVASKMRSDELFDLNLNGNFVDRMFLFGRALQNASDNTKIRYVLDDLNVKMLPNDTVTVHGRPMNRSDILEKMVREGMLSYPYYGRLAISMTPGQQFIHRNGEQMDREAVAQKAFDFVTSNPRYADVEATLAMVVINSQIPRDIDILQQLLRRHRREDFVIENLLAEPANVNYDALSIGGEDEREALIIATCANDLYNFAHSALMRRRALLPETEGRKRSGSGSGGMVKRARRKSKGW